MAARVVVNGASMAAFLATDPTMQKALHTTADTLMTKAASLAPRGSSVQWGPIRRRGKLVYSHHHGQYKESFYVRSYRSSWQVWNGDPFAHLMEWGSVRNPAYAPIRRAVRASGMRYVPSSNSRGA